MLRKLRVALLCLTLLTSPLSAFAQGPAPDPDVQAKIRKEGMDNAQIMRVLHYFTDVYGPRLTGSPNHENAAKWAIKEMERWGFTNAHLEAWDFGHAGWLNERASAHVLSPFKEPLMIEVLGWTPSTKGTVTAQVYQLIPPAAPTEDEFKAYLEAERPKIKDKIVMVGKHAVLPVVINPPAKRMDDAQAKARFSGSPTAGGPGNRPGGPGGPPQQPPAQPGQPKKLNAREVAERLDDFLLTAGALVRFNDSGMEQRRIRAFNNRTFDPSKNVPTAIISNEDYGRISRILADGTPVEVEVNIVNRDYPEGKTSYNAIAEVPGTDKKDEVIMLGGHLDSWHAATGATDNAIGCATMMEAARIINALVKAGAIKAPRRTIRVALWSGEEQGLLGSLAYVKEHFGSAENPKPEFAKFGGYFNIDSGTGKARGMSVFGPEESATGLRAALAPFEDLGFFGVLPSRSRGLGGSDHTSFNQAGLPGIGVAQDPIEYFNITWHTNLDTYERIIEDDAKKSAIVIAAAIYYLATTDALLPRFAADQMPALPP
ncbi:MAG: M28 family peptidase, partial [Acidobacteria bacterium]|nr:M28 family peptidase [Acidobacteriota bacterium]